MRRVSTTIVIVSRLPQEATSGTKAGPKSVVALRDTGSRWWMPRSIRGGESRQVARFAVLNCRRQTVFSIGLAFQRSRVPNWR